MTVYVIKGPVWTSKVHRYCVASATHTTRLSGETCNLQYRRPIHARDCHVPRRSSASVESAELRHARVEKSECPVVDDGPSGPGDPGKHRCALARRSNPFHRDAAAGAVMPTAARRRNRRRTTRRGCRPTRRRPGAVSPSSSPLGAAPSARDTRRPRHHRTAEPERPMTPRREGASPPVRGRVQKWRWRRQWI